jgi:hypothetical protein
MDMRDTGLVVDRLLQARRRAKFEREDRRLWRVGPAPESLDQRFANRAWLIAQLAFERGTPLR